MLQQPSTMKGHSSRGVPRMAESSGGRAPGGYSRESSAGRGGMDREGDGKKNVAAGPSLDVALAGLLILLALSGGCALLAYKSMNMHFVVPLDGNASLDRFSEGRAMNHITALAGFGRQV